MTVIINSVLDKLIDLEADAREFGFDWPNSAMIIDQTIDECREIKEAIEKNEGDDRIQEEIGDLLHAAISLCIFMDFDVHETLEKVSDKFKTRMQAMKTLTQASGLQNLQGQSIEFMLTLWQKAKLK